MNKKLLIMCYALFALAGCGDDVPKVQNPHNIVIDGKKLTHAEYLDKFCVGKANNGTCLSVLQAKKKDSTRGEMPTSW